MNELWRLRNDKGEIVCSVCEIRDPFRAAWDNARLGFELRVDRNGELYLAIADDRDSGVLLLHCGRAWNVRGIVG